jgi:hypothetical protein
MALSVQRTFLLFPRDINSRGLNSAKFRTLGALRMLGRPPRALGAATASARSRGVRKNCDASVITACYEETEG